MTDFTLEKAIREVGLPADVEVLRAAFNGIHGGKPHAANTAWNRAVKERGFRFVGDRVDFPDE
jgi:hypothetical protein